MTELSGIMRRLIWITVLLGAVRHGKISPRGAVRLYREADFRTPDDRGEMFSDLPKAPQNVRVLIDHEREIPVELVYRGRDNDGCHVWIVPYEMRLDHFPRCIHVLCDVLPVDTSIQLEFYGTAM